MLLPDKGIKALCTGRHHYEVVEPVPGQRPDLVRVIHQVKGNDKPMIHPFVGELKRKDDNGNKIISYGLSSYGYDVRLSDAVKIFTNVNSEFVDPMNPSEETLVTADIKTNEKGLRYFILPPNSYALGVTVETFSIPKTVTAVCVGKSTYARSCAIINVTPIEAGFEGQVVIEISNGSNLPILIYVDSGIAQFMFFEGREQCEIDYSMGNRKYQGQKGVTYSRV